MNRSEFFSRSLAGAASLTLPSFFARAQQDKPSPIKTEIVKEFVTVSHGNIGRVREMLENNHLLLHVSFDWGGGDFETGIEAAGHVGNKEIAAYLLGKGARYNIYLACMLGHLETVKNTLTFQPGLLNSKGPHGFTMLHHAKQGGDSSASVVEHLVSSGAKETKLDFYTRA